MACVGMILDCRQICSNFILQFFNRKTLLDGEKMRLAGRHLDLFQNAGS